MGVILDAQKRFAEAETFYRRALALDPNSASLYSNLGNHYLKQGQSEKARAAYLRVVAFDPADRNANSQLAQISVISGISVSPQRQHLGLYYLLYFDNLGQEEVCRFLRELLRHLRGSVIVLLDNSSTHHGEPLGELLRRHPRLHIEHFPASAPELNPDEGVWSLAKRELANGCPLDVDELMDDIIGSINGL
jgi:tetratricopeptide (TPR) repeat protein